MLKQFNKPILLKTLLQKMIIQNLLIFSQNLPRLQTFLIQNQVIMPQSKTTLLLCLEITNQAQSLRNQYKTSLLCSVCLLQILKAKVKISKSMKVKALEGMAYLVL